MRHALLCLFLIFVSLFNSAEDKPTPPAAPAATYPKGDVTKYTFDQSRIFPGTWREYWVYVPKQYDPAKPACVYVNQDGVQFKAPQVFDELIAKNEMPVTIGVFVMHGKVKPLSPEALDRFNRSYEYDGLGDAYVRFILEEILPDVEKKTAPDGRAIKLSQDPNDRALGGSSSGAICAFTAAWERSDAFHRVFSAIGTYVGLRGGNNYPTLIRKYEPKPLRVFLQDGSKDQNIYAGDWWMANQEMERALTFAGYEVNHAWGEGGHSGEHGTQIFADVMRWLWKDWPAPVKAGLGSKQMQEVLIPGEGWKLVADGLKSTRGLAANAKGEIFCADNMAGKILKVSADGKAAEFLADSKKSGALAFTPDNHLLAVGENQILSIDTDGKSTMLAEGLNAHDLAVRHDGIMYATEGSKVWLITAKGEKKEVDSGLNEATGVAFSTDQSLLYVADGRSHWVYSYQIQPDGSLKHKQKYYYLHMPDDSDDSGAQGMCVDREGRLYVATKLGIQFCDQAGRVNGIIPLPQGPAVGISFSSETFDTLLVTNGERVFSRKVKVKGAAPHQAPTKPAAPRL